LKATIEADPNKTSREIAKEVKVDHSTVVQHLHHIGTSKNFDKHV
jgi:transposase-like protein